MVSAAAVLTLATAACGDNNGTGPAANVASITLAPDSASNATVLKAATLQLTPKALDAQGNAIANPKVTYQSSDQTVATVSTTGLVTAVAAGNATITATSGGKTATAKITVPYTLTQINGQNISTGTATLGGLAVSGGFAALYPASGTTTTNQHRILIIFAPSAQSQPLLETGTYTVNGSTLSFTSSTPGFTYTGQLTSTGLTITTGTGTPDQLVLTFAR
jgi:alpha-amylase